jgi:HAD superfamily hydrolase (TIGR01509 family)
LRPELVIFDCDGVLIDSEWLACAIDSEILTELGFPISPAEVVRRFIGVPVAAMRAAIEAEWRRPLPADFEGRIQARLIPAYRSQLTAIPGMGELVRRLRRPACVASSSAPEKLSLGLELTGLLDVFAPHVFSASMVARGKPAPDLFLLAAQRMGAAPGRCVVVEDSGAGVEAAVRAGMPVIGFTAGRHCMPDHAARLRAQGAARIATNAAELARELAALDVVDPTLAWAGRAEG